MDLKQLFHGVILCFHSSSLLSPAQLSKYFVPPGVRVLLHDLSTQEMLEGVREGKLHVALMIQVSKSALDGSSFEELGRYAVCLAMHPAHPLARARKVALKKIASERLIAYTLSDYPEYHAWLFEVFEPLDRLPMIAEEHDSSTSLIASVEAGRGVALVQQGFQCLAGPRLTIRPVTPAPPPFIVGVACGNTETLPFVRAFIAAAKRANPSTHSTQGSIES